MRPRCSAKFPKTFGSTSPMVRSMSILIRASVVCANAARATATRAAALSTILRTPVLALTGGRRFCRSCVSRWRSGRRRGLERADAGAAQRIIVGDDFLVHQSAILGLHAVQLILQAQH